MPKNEELTFQTLRGLKIVAKAWGDAGSSKYRILALHGWLDNAGTWDLMLEKLFELVPNTFHVVCLDLPGHGRSEHRPLACDYSMNYYIEDTISIAEALEAKYGAIWSKFMLLGHSMGAAISTVVAGVISERVTHLIAIEALGPYVPLGRDEKEDILLAIAGLKRSSPKTVFESEAEAIQARMNGFHRVSEGASASLVARSLTPVDKGFIWSSDSRVMRDASIRYYTKAVHNFLHHIRCPTITIWGFDGIEKSARLSEKSRHISSGLTIIKTHGGHHLHMEPETMGLCLREILVWLEVHEAPLLYAPNKNAADAVGNTPHIPDGTRRVFVRPTKWPKL